MYDRASPTPSQSSADGHWTPAMERMLRQWKLQLAARKRAHELCAARLSERDRALGLLGLILTISLGTLNTSFVTQGTAARGVTEPLGMTIATAIISWGAAVVTAAQRLFNTATQSEQHRGTSRALQALMSLLEVELAKKPARRGDMDNFVERITTQMTSISDHAPIIPAAVLARFPELATGDGTGSEHCVHVPQSTLGEMLENGGALYVPAPTKRTLRTGSDRRSDSDRRSQTARQRPFVAGDIELGPVHRPMGQDSTDSSCDSGPPRSRVEPEVV
jgi:hypothetical protein